MDMEQEELEMLYDMGNTDILTNEGYYQIVYSESQENLYCKR